MRRCGRCGMTLHDLALAWLTICALSTVLAVGAYMVGQQMGRRGADDVPRTLAQRAAQQLGARAEPGQVVGSVVRDLSADSSPFLIVYDLDHHVLASSVTVAGAPPRVPSGVLDAAVEQGEHRVTWQPIAGVHEASVVQSWSGGSAAGTVVAGTALAPAEARSRSSLDVLAAGWPGCRRPGQCRNGGLGQATAARIVDIAVAPAKGPGRPRGGAQRSTLVRSRQLSLQSRPLIGTAQTDRPPA